MTGSARILFLLGTLEIGGSERKTVRVANQLAMRGGSVELAYLRKPETLLPEVASYVPVTYLKERRRYSPTAMWRLAALVRRRRIDTVVAVNLYPMLYASPVVGLFGRRRHRLVVSVNTSESMGGQRRDYMKLYAPLLRRADQVVFGANSQRGAWLTRYSLDPARSSVIHNGVDAGHFAPGSSPVSGHDIRKRLGIARTSFVFICVSNLRPEKAHVNQLEALALIEREHGLRPHLLLVGEGPERARIEERAVDLGLHGRVHLVGEASDVRPYLAAASAFLLSSIAVETFSNAALEAAAAGLPVILSDVGGAREMFPDGIGGLIYPRDEIASLADCMVRLQMPGEAHRQGSLARAAVQAQFSIEQMADAWDAILRKGPPLTANEPAAGLW